MGNFNLKSIWKQTGGTGGSTNLEQRVQAIENGYFKKEGGQHQTVRNSADFFANIVLKQNGYVDHVDTNGATSMINKQYLEQQLTTTKNQIRSENNTFTGTNTFNTGSNLLTYTSTNTTKPDNEVITRKDLTYERKVRTSFNISSNGYQTAEFTINDLTTGLNEFFVVMCTPQVDISFDFAIQVNNLNYPNSSDIKVVTTSNLTNSNIDNFGYFWIAFTIYGNNKLRFRAKSFQNGQLTFNRVDIYMRRPAQNRWGV